MKRELDLELVRIKRIKKANGGVMPKEPKIVEEEVEGPAPKGISNYSESIKPDEMEFMESDNHMRYVLEKRMDKRHFTAYRGSNRKFHSKENSELGLEDIMVE